MSYKFVYYGQINISHCHYHFHCHCHLHCDVNPQRECAIIQLLYNLCWREGIRWENLPTCINQYDYKSIIHYISPCIMAAWVLEIKSKPNYFIPAKPLHNHDIVSVHFNYFYCMVISNKLNRVLAMLAYIYLNVDDCWLTSPMPHV